MAKDEEVEWRRMRRLNGEGYYLGSIIPTWFELLFSLVQPLPWSSKHLSIMMMMMIFYQATRSLNLDL